MVSATQTERVWGLATPANIVTIARICASPVLFLLILQAESAGGASWAVVAVGLLLGFSDYLDGRLARRNGTVTKGGAFLDPLADKIVVLGAMACYVVVGRYWWLPVALIAGRELWVSALRVRFARQGLSIPASKAAKWKTTVQALALLLVALPPLREAPVVIDVALWLAVALTLYTGLHYAREGASMASRTGA